MRRRCGPLLTVSDPYANVLTLHATASEDDRKHVVLWPPNARSLLQTDRPLQRNLATVQLELGLDGSCRIDEAAQDSAAQPLACSLRQGDSLWVPKGWWHAVRNGKASGASTSSWSAAIGAWFLPRGDASVDAAT